LTWDYIKRTKKYHEQQEICYDRLVEFAIGNEDFKEINLEGNDLKSGIDIQSLD